MVAECLDRIDSWNETTVQKTLDQSARCIHVIGEARPISALHSRGRGTMRSLSQELQSDRKEFDFLVNYSVVIFA